MANKEWDKVVMRYDLMNGEIDITTGDEVDQTRDNQFYVHPSDDKEIIRERIMAEIAKHIVETLDLLEDLRHEYEAVAVAIVK